MKKQNVRTLALIVCAFTYLLVGAAIFDALESKREVEDRKQHDEEEEELKRTLNLTDEQFESLRRTMLNSKYFKAGVQWKFSGSFYFALTVFTTIGYGHSTPKTPGGRMFCMAYALGGIPLGLVMFQSIGERLNMFITYALSWLKRCAGARRPGVSHAELIAVSCSLCAIVLLAGAAAFSHVESWSFADAFYYCFITLATIGFGDYVALQEDHALQRRPEYVAFSVLYILFGLTVFAAALNLLVLHLLTMNTADERKDELEALAVARSSAHLDGDVITPPSAMVVVGVGGGGGARSDSGGGGGGDDTPESGGGGGGSSTCSSGGSESAVATLLSPRAYPHHYNDEEDGGAQVCASVLAYCCCCHSLTRQPPRGDGRGGGGSASASAGSKKEVTFGPFQYSVGMSSTSQMAHLLSLHSDAGRADDEGNSAAAPLRNEHYIASPTRGIDCVEEMPNTQQACKRASV